jgi:hypothetical protein
VCLGQENNFTVEGVVDPFAGDTHISKLPLEYHKTMKDFMRHILFGVNKGNTSRLTSWLARWAMPINHMVTHFGNKAPEEVEKYLAQDRITLQIRNLFGFGKSTEKPKEKTDAVAVESAASADVKDVVQPQPPKKLKEPKALSMQDIFIDALFLSISGKEDEALKLYQQAEQMGYQEKDGPNKDKKDGAVSQQKQEVLNSLYAMIFPGILKRNPKKAAEYTQKMALKKVPQALYNMAFSENDKVAQEKLLKEAADLGHDISQRLMGERYIKKDNAVEAKKYLTLAAEQEDLQAQKDLFTFYFQGFGGSKPNLDLAIKYYEAAGQNILSDLMTPKPKPIVDDEGFKKVRGLLNQMEKMWQTEDDSAKKTNLFVRIRGMRSQCREYQEKKDQKNSTTTPTSATATTSTHTTTTVVSAQATTLMTKKTTMEV